MLYDDLSQRAVAAALAKRTAAALGGYYFSFYHIRQYPATEKGSAGHHDRQDPLIHMGHVCLAFSKSSPAGFS